MLSAWIHSISLSMIRQIHYKFAIPSEFKGRSYLQWHCRTCIVRKFGLTIRLATGSAALFLWISEKLIWCNFSSAEFMCNDITETSNRMQQACAYVLHIAWLQNVVNVLICLIIKTKMKFLNGNEAWGSVAFLL